MNTFHTSVLLHETVEALGIQKGYRYIDATLGGGGHTKAILERGGIVLGIDTDNDAIAFVRESIGKIFQDKLTIRQGNFRDIEGIAKSTGFEAVHGIVFDLGVSSYQVDTEKRGFSFQRSGPLDMRMGTDVLVTARDLVNGLHGRELTKLFLKYGEEPRAKTIATAIVTARETRPIETTAELAGIIVNALGRKIGDIHPATRVFQALRIAVNDELHSLELGLAGAKTVVQTGGRIAVITFHSLEDRIVKHIFDQDSEIQAIFKKPIIVSDQEMTQNRRSRSAKLRVFEKQI